MMNRQQKASKIQEQLKNDFNLLKSLLDDPQIFIAEQLDELKRFIDTECQKFLIKFENDNQDKISYRIAVERQAELISQIETFQEICLSNLNATFEDNTKAVENLESQLKAIDFKTNEFSLNAPYESFQLNLSSFKKKLFCNKSVLFFSADADFVKQLVLSEPRFSNGVRLMSFGLLEIFEDAHISQQKISQIWKEDLKDEVFGEEDLLAFLVKEVFYGRIFNLIWATDYKEPVNRTTLNISQRKKLDLKGSIKNRQIGAWTFRGLTNLESLSLTNNNLQIIDEKAFKDLSNLKLLGLSGNKLVGLEALKDLTNLIDLDLSRNELELLDPQIFKGLINLINLDLSKNCFCSFKPGVFSYLSKLEVLELAHNKISELDSNIFTGLNKLCVLDLANNKIAELSPRVFDELVALNQLSLVNNLLVIDNCFKANLLRNNEVYIHL